MGLPLIAAVEAGGVMVEAAAAVKTTFNLKKIVDTLLRVWDVACAALLVKEAAHDALSAVHQKGGISTRLYSYIQDKADHAANPQLRDMQFDQIENLRHEAQSSIEKALVAHITSQPARLLPNVTQASKAQKVAMAAATIGAVLGALRPGLLKGAKLSANPKVATIADGILHLTAEEFGLASEAEVLAAQSKISNLIEATKDYALVIDKLTTPIEQAAIKRYALAAMTLKTLENAIPSPFSISDDLPYFLMVSPAQRKHRRILLSMQQRAHARFVDIIEHSSDLFKYALQYEDPKMTDPQGRPVAIRPVIVDMTKVMTKGVPIISGTVEKPEQEGSLASQLDMDLDVRRSSVMEGLAKDRTHRVKTELNDIGVTLDNLKQAADSVQHIRQTVTDLIHLID